MVTAWLQKDSPSHLTSETAAQQHHATNSQRNPSQYSTTQKQKNKRKTRDSKSTYMRLLTTWGPSRIQSLKTYKKPWKLDPMRGGPSSMMTDNSHAKIRFIGLHNPLPARAVCYAVVDLLTEFMCVQ
jgi:hypothetical protein